MNSLLAESSRERKVLWLPQIEWTMGAENLDVANLDHDDHDDDDEVFIVSTVEEFLPFGDWFSFI